MQKLKKGDEVIVTAGKDKGKRAKIEKVFPTRTSVRLPGVNIFKRHIKKRDEKHPGGIIDFPRPLPFGSVALICPKCNKPTRVGFSLTKDKKIRICKRCSAQLN